MKKIVFQYAPATIIFIRLYMKSVNPFDFFLHDWAVLVNNHSSPSHCMILFGLIVTGIMHPYMLISKIDEKHVIIN